MAKDKSGSEGSESIDAYIADFPKDVQTLLKKLRMTIRKAAPKAEEKIAYGMPTFAMLRNIVYFAGYKHHIGLYPGGDAMEKFKKQMTKFKTSRGTVQFALDAPLPTALITQIVKYKVKLDLKKKPKPLRSRS